MSAIHDFPDLQQQQQQPPGGAGIGAPPHRRRRRRRRGRSAARRRRPVFSSEPATATGAATTDGGGGSSFGGLSDSDAQSSARLDSECGSSGIFSYNHSRMESSSSDDEIDLESGELEMKVHCGGGGESEKKQCRICHLNFEVCGGGVSGAAEEEDEDDGGGGGDAIELGCNCKGDLGTAHKQCAETWFKIRGNMTCEICGAIAQNVGGEQTNETSNAAIDIEAADQLVAAAMAVGSEPQNFWQGRRIMNILLGCMVFAFIISWLFHFNVLP